MRILICGATCSGMTCAVQFARAGHRVHLITELFYPGEDTLGTMRAVADPNAREWMEQFCEKKLNPSPAEMKKALLEKLTKEKIELSFATHFIAPLVREKRICGALLLLPNGIQEYACDIIVDATMLGAPSFHVTGQAHILKSGTVLAVRATMTGDYTQTAKNFSDDLSVCIDQADAERIHFCTTALLPRDMMPSEAYAFLAQKRTELFRSVIHPKLQCDTAQPQMLEILQPIERPDVALNGWMKPEAPLQQNEASLSSEKKIVLNGILIPYQSEYGLTSEHYAALRQMTCKVLVCGGGTAGIWAALASARAGVDTICLERCGLPGGTRTLGGVSGLYCGNRNQIFQTMWEEIQQFAQCTIGRKTSQQVLEALFYHKAMADASARLFVHACVAHARVSQKNLQQVLVVGEDGLFAIRAEQYIDGTGEGLLCHIAGCPSSVGEPRFHMTQNYSQWNRCTKERASYRPIDQNVMNPTSNREWMRCIRYNLEHATEYDLFEILTTRETRRIQGRKQITLRTVARGTRWPDTIYDAYSTFDPHGRSFCAEGRLGALPALGHGRFAAIPLGAIQPQVIDNLLVTGKAISCSQEGMNFIRMNADIMSIGYIAGLLASRCVQLHLQLEQLPLAELQAWLINQGAMIAEAPEKERDQVTASSLFARILAGEDDSVINEAILAQPDGLDILLRRARMNHSFSNEEMIDFLLLLYGDLSVTPKVIERLQYLDKKCGTVLYQDRQRDTGVILGGVHGKADDYWQINRLMILMGRCHILEAADALCAVLDHTVPGGDWKNKSSIYSSIRLDTNTIPNYDRILCLADALENIPTSKALPGLQRLMDEISVIPPPSAPIWRDYLMMRLIGAYLACGGTKRWLEGRYTFSDCAMSNGFANS